MSSSLGLDLARYRAALASAIPLADMVSAELAWPPMSVPVLAEELAEVPDPRRAAGRRFDLVFLLSVVVMATLAGAQSISGILRWAAKTDPAVLAALARGGPCRLPAHSTLARLLARLDGDAVDDAFARYTAAVLAPGDPQPGPGVQTGDDAPVRAVSLDGKSVRGAVTATTRAPHLVSVFRHDTKTIAAQRLVDVKTNEITVFADVLNVLPDLAGQVVVADALHTQRAHAHYLHRRDAYYLFPVAANQPNLFDAVNALPWDTAPVGHIEEGKAHGRDEKRITRVLPAPADLPFPHAAQVILTERTTTGRGDHKTHAVAALAITALPAHLARPADLAAIIRGHWGIEALHHVRDTTYAEDASRAQGLRVLEW